MTVTDGASQQAGVFNIHPHKAWGDNPSLNTPKLYLIVV